jgi:hypothetical protein
MSRAQSVSFSYKPINNHESLINDDRYLTLCLPLVQRHLIDAMLGMEAFLAWSIVTHKLMTDFTTWNRNFFIDVRCEFSWWWWWCCSFRLTMCRLIGIQSKMLYPFSGLITWTIPMSLYKVTTQNSVVIFFTIVFLSLHDCQEKAQIHNCQL